MPCILELRALVPDNAGNEFEDKQSEIHNASNYGYLVYFFFTGSCIWFHKQSYFYFLNYENRQKPQDIILKSE